jgi:hypothetical protein
MNRRGFLGALLAVPLAGVAAAKGLRQASGWTFRIDHEAAQFAAENVTPEAMRKALANVDRIAAVIEAEEPPGKVIRWNFFGDTHR